MRRTDCTVHSAMMLWPVCVVLMLGIQLAAGLSEGISHKVLTKLDTRGAHVAPTNIPPPSESGLTEEEKVALLDAHNEWRGSEGASNMMFMKWDSYLAGVAQEWASACLYEHGQPHRDPNPMPDQGQNLAFIGGGRVDPVTRANKWYIEKQYLTWDNMTCLAGKRCGHYTQLVWAETNLVGCGYAVCPELMEYNGNNWKNAAYLVCQYTPGGNVYDFKPYLIGDPCTACHTGNRTCYNNLCRDNCEADGVECECKGVCQNCGTLTDDCKCECKTGYHGIDCEKECVDEHARCNDDWVPWHCNLGGEWAWLAKKERRLCPLMCGQCKPVPENPETC